MSPVTRLASGALLVAAAWAESVPIATFDGAAATTVQWQPVNDPVMGGKSFSNFHVDEKRSLGIWTGQVRIVPFLGAPGFCDLMSPGLYKKADFPNLSSMSGIKVQAREANSSGLTHFNVMLMSKEARHRMQEGVYTANITLTPDADSAFAPWSEFVCTWRGQVVPWCPPLNTQLDKIDSVGLGTAFPGTPGDFTLEIESVYGYRPSPAAMYVDLATFDGKATHKWHSENDPVMGGVSDSTVQVAGSYAEFKGATKIVPSLKAPGFTIAMTEGAPFFSKFPDVSSMAGLVVSARSTGKPYTGFRIAFCDSHLFFRCQFQTFKANLQVPPAAAGQGFQEVFVPWKAFSDKWDAATGKHTGENPPTESSLRSITQLQIWAEGVEGEFDLEFDYIRAVSAAPSPAPVVILM